MVVCGSRLSGLRWVDTVGWSFVSLFLFFCFKTSVVENVVGSNVGGVIVMGAVADGMLTVGC